jgi:superfamily II DNA or RNA helicase
MSASNQLITNELNKNFLSTLKENLSTCTEFKICVSFVRISGVQLLMDLLQELNAKGVNGQILASTYMNVTQPHALEMLNSFDNIELKIFTSTHDQGFHAKGYLFLNPDNNNKEKWTIIIGSSNISGAAFKKNVEWNVINNEELLENHEPGAFAKSVLEEFNELWESPYSKDFSDEFLIQYRDYLSKIKKIQKENKDIFNFEEKVIKPNEMQSEAIAKLNTLRKMKQNKALAIAATGTGKTYMSVFDAMQVNPKKALFVVHRGDILVKAQESFDNVLGKTIPDYSSEIYKGSKHNKDCKYLFVTEDTLALHLEDFAPNEFEYIIIDEAHHAADNSYSKILNYFKPQFLLGLTATPERTDGKDIFSIFDFNRAVNIRLRDSLEKNLVCPFHYFGIKDVEGIDYEKLTYKPEDGEEYLNEVAKMLMKSKRADYIFEKINFYGHDGDKTKCLGFCATVDHAKFMAEEFNKKLGDGVAIALSGENSVPERQKYLQQLEDDDTKLQYIFSRDIFNEGIDVQDVNLVLMLRPTQSSIVFTQQLGRGLRKIKGKEFLTVLDFIGNYQKSFLMTSVFSKEPNPDKKTRLREVATDFVDIPGDTFIHFDKIVKEQILNQIDKEKFMSDTNQKKAYFVFRKDNGNRMPYLTDYIKHGSDLDPCVFSKIKKGNLLYHSYFEFVASSENEINSSESVILNQLSQNNIFTTFIRFIDSLLPAKRIEEWCVINQLISNSDFSASINDIKVSMQKYVDYYNEASLNNACSFLAGKFFDSTETKTYKDVIMSFDGKTVTLNQNVKELFSSSNKEEISKWINDYIEYALLRYDEEFGRNDYGFPFLKPYAKYSMRNIAPLCNYERIHSSFRGSGLLTSAKPQYFIFVDLYKADDIREEINYHDKFISSNVFQWQSPNNMTQDSDRGKDVINNTDRHTHLHLFVRKFKEVESIPQEFIYLGEVSTMLDTAKGECPVTMNFAIPELPADLYNDFITDVDKTKIEEKE